MGKRRGNNEGSIYQRPNGRWCAQISIWVEEQLSMMRVMLAGLESEAEDRADPAHQRSSDDNRIANGSGRGIGDER
jgi:hypothetical protein